MNWAERDLKVIWHPYTQMQTAAPPIPIVRGEGALLFDDQGNAYLDAVSSSCLFVTESNTKAAFVLNKIGESLR